MEARTLILRNAIATCFAAVSIATAADVTVEGGAIMATSGGVSSDSVPDTPKTDVAGWMLWGQSNAQGIGSGSSGLVSLGYPSVWMEYNDLFYAVTNSPTDWGLEMQATEVMSVSNSLSFGWSKTAVGGTSLDTDWEPDNTSGAQLYSAALADWRRFRSNMGLRGWSVDPDVMVWMQGEYDSNEIMHAGEEGMADRYYGNLTNLIARTRSDLCSPSMQIYVCRIHTNFLAGHAPSDVATVRAAQTNAALLDGVEWVDTDGLSTEDVYELHYDNGGLVGLGQRVADKYLEAN